MISPSWNFRHSTATILQIIFLFFILFVFLRQTRADGYSVETRREKKKEKKKKSLYF